MPMPVSAIAMVTWFGVVVWVMVMLPVEVY